jgi:hypothetical protein
MLGLDPAPPPRAEPPATTLLYILGKQSRPSFLFKYNQIFGPPLWFGTAELGANINK